MGFSKGFYITDATFYHLQTQSCLNANDTLAFKIKILNINDNKVEYDLSSQMYLYPKSSLIDKPIKIILSNIKFDFPTKKIVTFALYKISNDLIDNQCANYRIYTLNETYLNINYPPKSLNIADDFNETALKINLDWY